MTDILLLTSYEDLDKNFEPYLAKISPAYTYRMTKYQQLGTDKLNILKNVSDDVRVIITRGYPATVCKKYTNIHVVEIEVSLQDILRAINTTKKLGFQRIAIIAYSNMVDEKNSVIQYDNAQLYFLTLFDRVNDREKVIEFVTNNQIDAIIGSAFPYDIGKEMNIPSIMLESSEESMLKAINEATLYIDNLRVNSQKELKSHKQFLENGWLAKHTFADILGESQILKKKIYNAKKWASSAHNLLITGNTGTGKSLFAQCIHNYSDRINKPFIEINCSTIADNAIESELFGYEEGYYNGTLVTSKQGLLAAANGGTLYLDEIGEASLKFQNIISNILENKKFKKIGGDRYQDVKFRVICSTNHDLLSLIEKRVFKEDLYYRINELELNLPDLTARENDITCLAKHFIEKAYHQVYGRKINVSHNSLKLLKSYHWPGNVRELKNFASRYVYYCDGQSPSTYSIGSFFKYSYLQKSNQKNEYIKVEFSTDEKTLLKSLYRSLLLHYDGDKARLCHEFQISRSTLWRKLNGK